MKKLSIIIIAIALIFGMSQCKKNVETITSPSNQGKKVHITLNMGDNGDKHIVNLGTGAVDYTEGDIIYVGNGGHYVGTLTYSSGTFAGYIEDPSTDDYLHFYFVGGLTPSAVPVAGTTTDFTVNIADQRSKLPVLSYAHSSQKYVDGTTTYSCTLLNKCGLVKFVPATATPDFVIVGGMRTIATINFATPGITPTGETGKIKLYSESNAAKWAILLPQFEVSNPFVDIDLYTSTITSVPTVTENMYYTTGVSIAMSQQSAPTGSAGGTAKAKRFSVSDEKRVYFSQGNLQAVFTAANTTTKTWKFATNQYDYIGDAVANTKVDNNKVTEKGTVDLFGWVGANGSLASYGINNSTTSTNYATVVGEQLKNDWGHNAITNGGNTADQWRTLTREEYKYLFNTRKSSTVNGVANARFAKATVNSKAGLIIFPDCYTHPSGVTQPTNINVTGCNYTGNTYTTSQWSSMQNAGCVFLPAAGSRSGTTVSASESGHYWSSTSVGSESVNGSGIHFNTSNCNFAGGYLVTYGRSVRLVTDVE